MIRHRWEHHEVSGWGGFDCSCSRASFQENHQYHAHRRRALFLEAKVAVGKNTTTEKPLKSSTTDDHYATQDSWPIAVEMVILRFGRRKNKATKAIDNWKGSVQRKVLVERTRCLLPERGPRSQTHAQRRNLGISVRPGHPAPAATLPAVPAAAPSGAQDYRWFVRDPLGLHRQAMNWRPIRGWTRLLHEREMKADSMPERLLIGPGSPPSLDPVYPELSPPLEPCRKMAQKVGQNGDFCGNMLSYYL